MHRPSKLTMHATDHSSDRLNGRTDYANQSNFLCRVSKAQQRIATGDYPIVDLLAPELYSGHSLRRGFATWASANGWDVKMLMEYVGWKDVHSAVRYVDSADAFARRRISEMLTLESLPLKN